MRQRERGRERGRERERDELRGTQSGGDRKRKKTDRRRQTEKAIYQKEKEIQMLWETDT